MRTKLLDNLIFAGKTWFASPSDKTDNDDDVVDQGRYGPSDRDDEIDDDGSKDMSSGRSSTTYSADSSERSEDEEVDDARQRDGNPSRSLGRYLGKRPQGLSLEAPTTPSTHAEIDDHVRNDSAERATSTSFTSAGPSSMSSLPAQTPIEATKSGQTEISDHFDFERYADRVRGVRKTDYPALRGESQVTSHTSCMCTARDETDADLQPLANLSGLIDITYLDTSASPPTPTSLISQITTKLTSQLYTNPHSTSYSGTRTAEEIDRVREKVMLDLFGVKGEEGWDLVFTSGTTAGIKLVGECFFGKEAEGREYVYLDQAHTSLVGVRGYAEAEGKGKSRAISWNDLVDGSAGLEGSTGDRLVGIPAQCNASGRRYFDNQLFPRLRNNDRKAPIKGARTYYLLDAAAYLSSSTRMDLSIISHDDAPDYVVFSCYKLYGYPTGIGGLLVKRQSSEVILRGKTYFGGGTVDALAPRSNWTMGRLGVTDVLEDGSVDVHGIIGVGQAEDVYDRLFGSLSDRSRYVRMLLGQLVQGMADMKHAGGQPVIKIYMESQEAARCSRLREGGDMAGQGPIVNFNILHPSGRIIPPNEVDRLACIQNIHLRSGRHCNAGFIVNHLLNGSEHDIIEQYEQGVGCDQSANGAVVTASLRVSLGVHNTPEDVDRFLDFVRRFWKHDKSEVVQTAGTTPSPSSESYRLEQIMVYPIKSCAGQSLVADQDWKLTPHGLEHDREWILIDRRTGKGLSQKKYPRMALIRPRIDLDRRVMVIQAGQQAVTVDLDEDDSLPTFATSTQVCVDTVTSMGSGRYEAVDRMLSDFLALPCALARQVGPGRHSKLGDPSNDRVPLLLSNESPFLLLNDESVRRVSSWIQEGGEVETIAKAASFRGNFVIDRPMARRDGKNEQAFAEDTLYRLHIGPHTFIPLGACRRCQMVSIDQETGEKAPETFLAIAKRRRDERGRILFGTHLMWREEEEPDSERAVVRIGMDVRMIKQ